MKRSGIASRMAAMVSSSSASPAGCTSASGVPAWGTKVITRTCSHPESRMTTMERARSAAVSPMPVSRPSSTSRPARRAAARASARACERLPHAQALVELRRVGLLVQRVPVRPGRPELPQRRLRQHARRDHDGSPRLAGDAAHELEQRRVAGLVVDEGVLPHRQVEQDDTRRGEVAADGDDLVRGLAVARALVVVRAVEAEGALVAAVGREVHEAVEEHGVARVPLPLLARRREHQRRLVAGAQQRLEVARVRLGSAEDARAQIADGGAGAAHGSHRNSRTSSTGRRDEGLGGVSGLPTGTSATSSSGGSTPSSASMAGAASTGAVIQQDP